MLILKMPKSQTSQPVNIDICNFEESASEIAEKILLFFNTLLSSLALSKTENCVEAIRKKAGPLVSNVVFSNNMGNIRSWKNFVFGLGLFAVTSFKLVVQILNRQGHCINYSDVKAWKHNLLIPWYMKTKKHPIWNEISSESQHSLRLKYQRCEHRNT